jgi:hypothetical protein
MSYGGHLSMLIALIAGLAVTELLAGASRTLKRQKEADFSWLPFVQALLIGFLVLGGWFSIYSDLAGDRVLNVFAYITLLITPCLQYFAATSVFPTSEENKVSVYATVKNNARDVNLPLALWMLWAIAGNVRSYWPDWQGTVGVNICNLIAAAMFVIAAYSQRDWLRWSSTLIVLAYDVAFFIIFLPSLDKA